MLEEANQVSELGCKAGRRHKVSTGGRAGVQSYRFQDHMICNCQIASVRGHESCASRVSWSCADAVWFPVRQPRVGQRKPLSFSSGGFWALIVAALCAHLRHVQVA